ncbi:MAG: arsenate reductase (glutaredoxin) [Planctomycetota bacterium]|jgi:arsenate reductase
MSEHVTLYHNARCSKSRKTLQLLKDHQIKPIVIDYLAQPPSVLQLEQLARELGVGPMDMIRTNERPFKDLKLAERSDDPDALFEAMTQHPILIQRPIVVYKGKARIGRPPEAVLEVLD